MLHSSCAFDVRVIHRPGETEKKLSVDGSFIRSTQECSGFQRKKDSTENAFLPRKLPFRSLPEKGGRFPTHKTRDRNPPFRGQVPPISSRSLSVISIRGKEISIQEGIPTSRTPQRGLEKDETFALRTSTATQDVRQSFVSNVRDVYRVPLEARQGSKVGVEVRPEEAGADVQPWPRQ